MLFREAGISSAADLHTVAGSSLGGVVPRYRSGPSRFAQIQAFGSDLQALFDGPPCQPLTTSGATLAPSRHGLRSCGPQAAGDNAMGEWVFINSSRKVALLTLVEGSHISYNTAKACSCTPPSIRRNPPSGFRESRSRSRATDVKDALPRKLILALETAHKCTSRDILSWLLGA